MKLTARAVRKLIQAFARSIAKGNTKDWYRADGRITCDWCGYEYSDHPEADFPTLVILCNGQRVKV